MDKTDALGRKIDEDYRSEPAPRGRAVNAVKVVWLWQVTGGEQWRGVADTIG